MPNSFLARHRTICEVLYELQELHHDDDKQRELTQEALLYARRMSLKLTEYKQEKEAREQVNVRQPTQLES